MAYVPPHLRGRPQSALGGPPQPSRHEQAARNVKPTQLSERSAWWGTEHAVVEGQVREQDSDEVRAIIDYYAAKSDSFRRWTDTRQRGTKNPEILGYFQGKERSWSNTDDSNRRSWDTSIRPLFNKFLRYACDIDNGVQYAAKAAEIAQRQGSCWFLDFGFAPGGMSELLLATHADIRGVGVTLAPDDGGNVFPREFTEGKNGRFTTVLRDVVRMARTGESVVSAAGLPEDFPGFDLVIVGITVQQTTEGDDDYNALKDALHVAQLALTWPCLRHGGSVLMRHHMSLRLVDLHLLTWMLMHFRGPLRGPPGGPSGSVPPESEGFVAATKGMSEFSIRKTYWVLYEGFNPEVAASHGSLTRLARAVLDHPGCPGGAYGFDGANRRFFDAALADEPASELLERFGPALLRVLQPMWDCQAEALEGFMAGRKFKLCPGGANCHSRRRPGGCQQAHSLDEMIPAVLRAAQEAERKAQPFILDDGRGPSNIMGEGLAPSGGGRGGGRDGGGSYGRRGGDDYGGSGGGGGRDRRSGGGVGGESYGGALSRNYNGGGGDNNSRGGAGWDRHSGESHAPRGGGRGGSGDSYQPPPERQGGGDGGGGGRGEQRPAGSRW